MGKWESNKKLVTDSDIRDNVRVVLFVSRNKDNKYLNGFKQRRESFISTKSTEELSEKFKEFVLRGIEGENSRFYVSVNSRDIDKIRDELLVEILRSKSGRGLLFIQSLIASIASKKEYAKTKKWLLDIDTKDTETLESIKEYIKNNEINIEKIVETPNGYHMVLEHGFDSREFKEKFTDVEIKRDDMLLLASSTKCNGNVQ